jgi:hypothetical protein
MVADLVASTVITTSMTLFLSTRVAVATLLPAWMALCCPTAPMDTTRGMPEGMDYKIVVHLTGPSLDVAQRWAEREREFFAHTPAQRICITFNKG